MKAGPARTGRRPGAYLIAAVPGPLTLPAGALGGLKWLALALMLLDHANKFVLGEHSAVLPEITRSAAPLFSFVLAFNLARPAALASGAFGRTLWRLLAVGLLALPASTALYGGLPLNIMFTLFAGTLLLLAVNQRRQLPLLAAGAVAIAASMAAEYGIAGLATLITAYAYSQRPDAGRLALWVASVAALWLYNGDFWALLAVPMVLSAPFVNLVRVAGFVRSLPVGRLARFARFEPPRLRWFFYAVYPAHLTLLWAWVHVMGRG